MDLQSPRSKQFDWTNPHVSDDNRAKPITFKLKDNEYITAAAFPNDGSAEVALGSNAGEIFRFSISAEKVIKTIARTGLEILSLTYSHNSKMVIFSYDHSIHSYHTKDLRRYATFAHSLQFKKLILTPEEFSNVQIIAISDNLFQIWNYITNNYNDVVHCNFDVNIMCAATSVDHLVLAMADTSVYVYNFKSRTKSLIQNDYG